MKLNTLQLFSTIAVVSLACVTASTNISSPSDNHAVSTHNNNDTLHDNGSHGDHNGNDTHHDDAAHGEHHGIHVASINFDYVKQPLVVTLFMLVVVLCKIGFHKVHWLSSHVPESCLLILLGTAVGGILHVTQVDTSYFYYIHPETFFLFLLPPCILEAAYELHDTVFFQNLGTVLLYAVIGTLLNCFIIGPVMYGLALAGAMGSLEISFVQCLVFSSLIVAVDPVAVLAIFQEIGVNSVLYFLVFGESLLNDAVTVVLYNTMKALSTMEEIPMSEILLAFAAFFTVSLGGLSIGLFFGMVTSFVTRWTQHVRVVEPLEVLAMAYGAYLTAELFHFSGIISMIGCGLMQVHYAFHNISQNSATTVKYFIKMLSTTCDSIIFMFLGIALVRDDHDWNTGFVLFSVLLCLIVRFLVTMVLTVFANKTYRERQVNHQEQFIMGYGGLRGAVAFCLVAMLDEKTIPQKYIFQTAVFAVILFTVFFQGITIKPLVKKLNIMLSEDKVVSLYQEINEHVTDHALAGVENIIGRYGQNTLKEFMIKVDDNLKNVLQRDPFTGDQVIMELYKEIAIQHYLETNWGDDGDDSSQLMLYHASGRTEEDDVFDEKKHLVDSSESIRHIDPTILRRLQHMSVNDTVMSMQSRRSMPIRLEDRFRKSSAAETSISFDEKPKVSRSLSEQTDPSAVVRRRRLANKAAQVWRKSVSGPNYESTEQHLSAKHIRKILAKTAATNAFTKKTDRNLRNHEGTDIVYHLQEKQRRHNRYIRSQSVFGAMSPRQMSPTGSVSQLQGNDKPFSKDDAADTECEENKMSSTPNLEANKAAKNVEQVPRARRLTEGSKGLSVLYVPKFLPKSAVRLNEQQRNYVAGGRKESTGMQPPKVISQRFSLPLSSTSLKIEESVEDGASENEAANVPGVHGQASEEECVVLLPDERAVDPPATSQKGRGHLERQDDLKMSV